MIEIQNLSKTYHKNGTEVHALKNVSLTIEKGSIHGIMGLSGAGKSSLVRCINLLERPSAGEVFVSGDAMTKLSKPALRKKREKIGMIFQNFNLLQSKTIFENIAFPLEIIGLDKISIRLKVESLLQLVGLSEKAHMYPESLSGGQKQRVGIARALANSPDVLLCDEATSALDPLTTKQILNLLKSINAQTGVTLVVITHEMDVIKSICDHVTLLENGEIVESGLTNHLFLNPKSEKTKSFFWNDAQVAYKPKEGLLVRLSFDQDHAQRPILSQWIKNHDIEVNLLSGQIENIGEGTMGHLFIAVNGKASAIDDALKALSNQGIYTEVLHD